MLRRKRQIQGGTPRKIPQPEKMVPHTQEIIKENVPQTTQPEKMVLQAQGVTQENTA